MARPIKINYKTSAASASLSEILHIRQLDPLAVASAVTMSDAAEEPPLYLTHQFFRRTLEHGLQQVDLEVLEVQLTNLTRGGENYCSNIYRAHIKYRNAEGNVLETSLIVKSMPEEKQAILSRLHIYNKESIFYMHIKPKLETLMWRGPEASRPWSLGAKWVFKFFYFCLV